MGAPSDDGTALRFGQLQLPLRAWAGFREETIDGSAALKVQRSN